MTCSEGRRLMGRFRSDARLHDSERRGLMEHFAGCTRCRREGLAIDPTLLLLGASSLEMRSSEIVSIRQTVQAMRRARELERAGARPWRRVRRAAAMSVLLTALLLFPGGGQERLEERNATSGHQTPSSGSLYSLGEGHTQISIWDSLSLIENLDRPDARIYQWTEQDLSVVMIVDESLDL